MDLNSLVANHDPGVEQLWRTRASAAAAALAGGAWFHWPGMRADQRSWTQRYWCGWRLTAPSRAALKRRTSRPCAYARSTNMHVRNSGTLWIYQVYQGLMGAFGRRSAHGSVSDCLHTCEAKTLNGQMHARMHEPNALRTSLSRARVIHTHARTHARTHAHTH